MPLSKTTHGHGSQLWIKIGAGALTKVAQVDDIPELPTGSERELYETSNFDTEEFKEWKKLPLKDGVPVTIRGNYVINSASDALLQQADDQEGAVEYRIILKEGSDIFHCEGSALFYNLKRMNPKDAKRTFEITMKPVDAAGITEAP
jgi:predicted secreted protein